MSLGENPGAELTGLSCDETNWTLDSEVRCVSVRSQQPQLNLLTKLKQEKKQQTKQKTNCMVFA